MHDPPGPRAPDPRDPPRLRTFLLTYAYVPDMVERRQPYRAEHLARAQRRYTEGKLVIAGALTDPVDGAVLIVRAESEAEVYAWVADDPYAKAGLIRSVSVRELAVAVPPA